MLKKFINTISSFFNSEPDYTLPHGILYKRILKSSYDKFFYVDLKVPDTIDGRFDIKMKIVIESFYGRTKMYDQSFNNEKKFCECLIRNIWSNNNKMSNESKKLYHFVLQKVNKYSDKSLEDILLISSNKF